MAEALTTPQLDSAVAAGEVLSPEGSQIPMDGMDITPGAKESAPEQGGEPRVAEEKSFQSRYDKLQAKVGDIATYLETKALDGRHAVGLLNNLEKMLGHPELGPVVRQFFTDHTVSFPERKTQEEIEDEDFERPWMKDIAPVLDENRRLKEQVESLTRSQGMDSITRLTQDFLTRFPMTDEQKATFQKSLERRIDELGDAHGAQILTNLNTKERFDLLALPLIEPFRSDIEARRLGNQRQSLRQMATDAPGVATNAAAETLANQPLATSRTQAQRIAREAMKRAFSQGA